TSPESAALRAWVANQPSSSVAGATTSHSASATTATASTTRGRGNRARPRGGPRPATASRAPAAAHATRAAAIRTILAGDGRLADSSSRRSATDSGASGPAGRVRSVTRTATSGSCGARSTASGIPSRPTSRRASSGPANRPGSAVAPPSGTAGSSRVAGLGGPATSSGRPEPSPVIRYSHGPGGTGSSTTSLPCALTCRRPSREVTRRPVASGEPGGTVASTTPSVRATAQPKRTSISSGRWAVVVSSVDRGADGSSGQRTVGTST